MASRTSSWLQVIGMLSFLGGAIAILVALAGGPHSMIAVGVSAVVLSAVCLGLSAWIMSRRVDWNRIEAEQKLWASGPLGRKWLKLRRLLFRGEGRPFR